MQITKTRQSDDNEDNFIFGTVYETNLYKTKDEKYFTLCQKCETPYFIEENQYCPDCEFPAGDYHGDMMMADDVEKLAWSYLTTVNDKTLALNDAVDIIKSILKGDKEISFDTFLNVINKSAKYHVGKAHNEFDASIGYPVESYCERTEVKAFDETFQKVVWKAGFIVNDEQFEKAKNGELVGFSFGGKTYSQKLVNGEDS